MELVFAAVAGAFVGALSSFLAADRMSKDTHGGSARHNDALFGGFVSTLAWACAVLAVGAVWIFLGD